METGKDPIQVTFTENIEQHLDGVRTHAMNVETAAEQLEIKIYGPVPIPTTEEDALVPEGFNNRIHEHLSRITLALNKIDEVLGRV